MKWKEKLNKDERVPKEWKSKITVIVESAVEEYKKELVNKLIITSNNFLNNN